MAEFISSHFNIGVRRWQDLSAEENAFSQNTDIAHRPDADANVRRKVKKKFRNPGKAEEKAGRTKKTAVAEQLH